MGVDSGKPWIPPNPYVWEAVDINGLPLTISIPWNVSNGNVNGGTVFRSVGCRLSRIMIGIGPDGTPDTAVNTYTVPEGTTDFSANVLRNNGLQKIDDVVALQVTAGE